MKNQRKPSRKGPAANWLKGQLARRPLPVWVLVTTDILLLSVALVVFALFHHVLRHPMESEGIVSSRQDAVGHVETVYDVEEDDGTEIDTGVDFSSATETDISLGDDVPGAPAADAIPDDSGDTAGATDEAPEAAALDEDAADAAVEAQPVASSSSKVGEFFGEMPGDFGEVFPDKFTDGDVVKSSSGYKSGNVNVELKRYDSNGVVFYMADIYLRDISCLKTAFAQNTYGKAYREHTQIISQRINAIIAINGDNYGRRDEGVVIRNGELYRKDTYPDDDVCVLYWDGTMETYPAGKFNVDDVMANGAYQAWNFGPRLLTSEGKAKKSFHSAVASANPRTALGYFEPGHYCFVVVDGRSDDSGGLTLQELAKLMHDLGCARAYNMDGGNTSVMVAGGRIVSNPSSRSNQGRETSDIIAIVDN